MSARMGWQWVVPIARSGERWQRGRKLLDRGLRPGAAALHRPMLQARARVLLTRLLTDPQRWEGHIDLSIDFSFVFYHVSEHLFSFQGESILAMTYGYEVHGHEDRMIDAAKRMHKFGAEKILPGALLVNYISLRM
jgi:hypothetical protein